MLSHSPNIIFLSPLLNHKCIKEATFDILLPDTRPQFGSKTLIKVITGLDIFYADIPFLCHVIPQLSLNQW